MTVSPHLTILRMLSGAFIGCVALLAAIMVPIAPDTVVPEPWALAVLLGLVAGSTVLSLVMVGTLPAASQADTVRSVLPRVQRVHIVRLVIMETPVLVSVIVMMLTEEPSWVTVAVAAVPTIPLMLWLVFPHQGVLRTYERALDAGGTRTQFADTLRSQDT